jgi:hypothetical protein
MKFPSRIGAIRIDGGVERSDRTPKGEFYEEKELSPIISCGRKIRASGCHGCLTPHNELPEAAGRGKLMPSC